MEVILIELAMYVIGDQASDSPVVYIKAGEVIGSIRVEVDESVRRLELNLRQDCWPVASRHNQAAVIYQLTD